MTELLPCPLCKSAGHVLLSMMRFMPYCSNTECLGHSLQRKFTTKEAATAAWNRRTPPPADAALERMTAAYRNEVLESRYDTPPEDDDLEEANRAIDAEIASIIAGDTA